MTAVVITWQEWDSVLFRGFHMLLEESILCDTVLMGCDGQSRPAHSFILAAASPVLRAQLTATTRTHQYQVCLNSISGHVWKLILQFLYSGKIHLLNKLEAECVIKAAIQLQILQLQLVGEQYLVSRKDADIAVKKHDGSLTKTESLTEEKAEGKTLDELFTRNITDTEMQVDGEHVVTDTVVSAEDDKEGAASQHSHSTAVKEKKRKAKSEMIKVQQLNEDYADEDGSAGQESDGTSGIWTVFKHDRSSKNVKPSASECQTGNKSQKKKQTRNRKSSSVLKSAEVQEDKYKCGVCPEAFPKRTLLSKHVIVHMKDGRWPCTECDKVYLRRHELIIHRRKHTGDRPYRCSICGNGFIRSTHLRDHKRIHSGDKPFKCRFCSFFSSWRTTVSNHENVTHFGLRPFTCETCGDTFTKRVGLDKHKLLHTGEKPYVCGTCGHAFVQRCTWREHERRHWVKKPFSCEQCGRQFVTRRSMVAHMRCHSGDRPFLCAFCGSTFTTHSILQSHQRRHTEGKTPHSCHLCPKMYAKKRSLVHHLFKVHGVDVGDNDGVDVGDNDGVDVGDDHDDKVTVSCPQCSLEFGDEAALRIHMDQHV